MRRTVRSLVQNLAPVISRSIQSASSAETSANAGFFCPHGGMNWPVRNVASGARPFSEVIVDPVSAASGALGKAYRRTNSLKQRRL